jgi:Cu(I)/Ag(I) efflux system membrane fusion protein
LGKEVIGKIEFINPEVNPQSRINLLRVLIPNEGNQLKPGMPAYIVVKSAKNNSITLPGDAVLKTKDMSMIWLKTGINTFKTIMVTTGMENGGKIEITNGLKDGDVVVISGVYLLNSEFLLRNGGDAMGGMPGMKM